VRGYVVHGLAVHGLAVRGLVVHGLVVHGLVVRGLAVHMAIESERDRGTTALKGGQCITSHRLRALWGIVAPRLLQVRAYFTQNAIDKVYLYCVMTGVHIDCIHFML